MDYQDWAPETEPVDGTGVITQEHGELCTSDPTPICETDLRAKIAADIAAERTRAMAAAQSAQERAWASVFFADCEQIARGSRPRQ